MQSRQGLSRLQLSDNAGGAKNVNTGTRRVTLVWCSWYALVLCGINFPCQIPSRIASYP